MRPELERLLSTGLELRPEELPGFLGEMSQVFFALLPRLSAPAPVHPSGPDELLGIEEAARRLGMTTDYMYRHSGEFPFTRRNGRNLRFSARGIEEHINQGRGATSSARRRIRPLSAVS